MPFTPTVTSEVSASGVMLVTVKKGSELIAVPVAAPVRVAVWDPPSALVPTIVNSTPVSSPVDVIITC